MSENLDHPDLKAGEERKCLAVLPSRSVVASVLITSKPACSSSGISNLIEASGEWSKETVPLIGDTSTLV